MARTIDELRFQVNENVKDISGLKMAVYGDNNGAKGLIRRQDNIEGKLVVLLRLSWLTVSTAVAALVGYAIKTFLL